MAKPKVSYQKLWDLLESRGITKDDLWRKYNVHSVVISRLENNQHVFDTDIHGICRKLKCQPEDIMEEIEEETAVETSRCLTCEIHKQVEESDAPACCIWLMDNCVCGDETTTANCPNYIPRKDS